MLTEAVREASATQKRNLGFFEPGMPVSGKAVRRSSGFVNCGILAESRCGPMGRAGSSRDVQFLAHYSLAGPFVQVFWRGVLRRATRGSAPALEFSRWMAS